MDAVVFAKGDYQYECAYGTATVHVPHDVMMKDIAAAIRPLAERVARRESSAEENCLPDNDRSRNEKARATKL